MRRTIAWIVLGSLSLAAVATTSPGVVDRIVHQRRYATTGSARLPAADYVAAARAALRRDERIALLVLPIGEGPVVASAWPAAQVYLDPPTARVLDVVRGAAGEGARPIGGAQPVADVVTRARPYGGGGALRSIAWPTERTPDWTLGFGKAGALVKVADDSGTARAAPVRTPGGAARWLDEGAQLPFGWRVAILLGGIAGVALVLARIARRKAVPAPR